MKKIKFLPQPDTGRLSEQDAKRYFSTVGFATFVLILLFYAGNIALSILVLQWKPEWAESAIVGNLISMLPLYLVAVPVFYLILRRLPKDTVVPEPMGAGDTVKGLFVAVTMVMAGNYVGNLFLTALQTAMGRSLTNPLEERMDGVGIWINLIFVVILAPILEELVFRKLLCDRLLPLGEGYTVILSSAVFALAHGNFFQVFYAFSLGMLFSTVYIKTGRIRYSILYHMAINGFTGLFASWLIGELSPLLSEEGLNRMIELMEAGNMEALSNMLTPYFMPLVLFLAYELILLGGSALGIVFLILGRKKLRFTSGLLAPPKEGRVANVFCNVGVAATLTLFAAIFVLSLL